MSGSGQRARALNTPASILFFPIIFAFPFLIYNSPSINTVCKASGKNLTRVMAHFYLVTGTLFF